MSRTYKDRPFLVRSKDPQGDYYEVHRHQFNYDCTIDSDFKDEGASDNPYQTRIVTCARITKMREVRKFDRMMFHRAVRRENEFVTSGLVKDYNTYGELEDGHIFTPHKKSAMFGGGYMD